MPGTKYGDVSPVAYPDWHSVICTKDATINNLFRCERSLVYVYRVISTGKTDTRKNRWMRSTEDFG